MLIQCSLNDDLLLGKRAGVIAMLNFRLGVWLCLSSVYFILAVVAV